MSETEDVEILGSPRELVIRGVGSLSPSPLRVALDRYGPGVSRLSVLGESAQNYQWEFSTDLKTWNPLPSFFGNGVLDYDAIQQPQRFYRAVAR